MNQQGFISRHQPLVRISLAIAAFIIVLVWMEGGFHSKAAPGLAPPHHVSRQPNTVKPSFQTEKVIWPGIVQAANLSRLAPRISGRIQRILVQRGDPVSPGQLLAEIENTEAGAGRREAEAAYRSQQAEWERARSDHDRIRKLFRAEAATEEQMEHATQTLNSRHAQMQAAAAALAAAQSGDNETRLIAPFQGKVIRRLHDLGDVLQANEPLLEIQSSQAMQIETAVPEHCIGNVDTGLIVKVEHHQSVLDASVREVSPAADPISHAVTLKLDIHHDGPLRAGSFVDVAMPCGDTRVMTIPLQSIRHIGQMDLVRVSIGDDVIERSVRLGRLYGDDQEILSGLHGDENIVLDELP